MARTLKGGEVLLLWGQLGSGKTTFTKGLANGLGISDRLLSPTFIIVRHYKIKNEKLGFLYHYDLYRLQNKEDIEEIGLEDIIKDEKSIVAIEWPDKLEGMKLKKSINIRFSYLNDDERSIIIE